MAFLPRTTCRRCGREYEGFRSRCPYCGTRKVRQSERTPSTTAGLNEGTSAYARRDLNTRWQLIFAVILLVAVLLAVIVLVSQGLNQKVKATPTPVIVPTTFTPIPPTETPPPTATPTLEKLVIMSYAHETNDITIQKVGQGAQLQAQAYPNNIEIAGHVKWTSADEKIVKVTDAGFVEAVGVGWTRVTAEVFGFKAEVICRVREAAD